MVIKQLTQTKALTRKLLLDVCIKIIINRLHQDIKTKLAQ